MSDKKAVGPAYPGAPPQPPTFVPGPPQPTQSNPSAPPTYGVPGAAAATYGMFPGQAGQLYAAQGPSPPYEQALAHPAMLGQQVLYYMNTEEDRLSRNRNNMYPPAATMYAAAGYPGYLSYPAAYAPMQYYPSLAYTYPPVQPTHLRPTIMIPNGFDGGARFDGIGQPVLPPAPPGVPPSAAQLAAMAGHSIALGQKKNTFLAGGSEGGYTFW